MNTKRFSLRFNLDREDDRRAWEALHRMDARSINQEIIARINAKEQTDVLKELITYDAAFSRPSRGMASPMMPQKS